MYYRSHKKNQTGFTLVELIIAIAVFSIGIMAAFTLALGNWRTDKENYNRVMAGDLAREGIELVRYIRDSNWLRIDNNETCDEPGFVCKWDSYMNDQDFQRLFIDYESFYLADPFKFFDGGCGGTIEQCVETCDNMNKRCVLQYDPEAVPEDRIFYHDLIATDHLTIFKRVIDLEAICFDGITEEVADGEINCDDSYPGYEKIGLRVSSIVGWNSFGSDKNVKATEYLYNWRR